MGGPLEKHEFHPRPDHPRICHVCGRHENSMLHFVTPKRFTLGLPPQEVLFK